MFNDMAWDISPAMIDPFLVELLIAPCCPSNSVSRHRLVLTSGDMIPRMRAWN
jgi:hypothetical protein